MTASRSPLVDVTGVDKWFGSTHALRGVDLAIEAGQCLGLVGRNGAGKSTLVSILSGLVEPDAGAVRFDGTPAPRVGDVTGWRQWIATVFQHSMVIPDLSVAENLILRRPGRPPFAHFGVVNWPEVGRWAVVNAKQFDIWLPNPWVPIRWLSGGNMQKVVLAREFGDAPQVLIAAQPTRGLDLAATEYVYTMLDAMRGRGGAVLLISDDLDEILKLSDRLIVLHAGEVMGEFGPHSSREQIGLAMTGMHVLERGPEPENAIASASSPARRGS